MTDHESALAVDGDLVPLVDVGAAVDLGRGVIVLDDRPGFIEKNRHGSFRACRVPVYGSTGQDKSKKSSSMSRSTAISTRLGVS